MRRQKIRIKTSRETPERMIKNCTKKSTGAKSLTNARCVNTFPKGSTICNSTWESSIWKATEWNCPTISSAANVWHEWYEWAHFYENPRYFLDIFIERLWIDKWPKWPQWSLWFRMWTWIKIDRFASPSVFLYCGQWKDTSAAQHAMFLTWKKFLCILVLLVNWVVFGERPVFSYFPSKSRVFAQNRALQCRLFATPQ